MGISGNASCSTEFYPVWPQMEIKERERGRKGERKKGKEGKKERGKEKERGRKRERERRR